MTKNRRLVDQLGDIRSEITDLEKKADKIREEILAQGEAALDGDDYQGAIKAFERESLDSKAIIAWYGRQELERFLKVTQVTTLYVKRRK